MNNGPQPDNCSEIDGENYKDVLEAPDGRQLGKFALRCTKYSSYLRLTKGWDAKRGWQVRRFLSSFSRG